MATKHVDIWANCLRIIREEISEQSFDTWFRPIKPVRLEQHVLTIEVPSQFFYEWLEEHYVGLLKQVIRDSLGPEGQLEYSIIMDRNLNGASEIKLPTSPHGKAPAHSPSLKDSINGDSPIPNPFVIPGIRKFEVPANLNPAYTFESLIEGDCNRIARSAGYAVATKPGVTAFNPLFIHSRVGLGKTHLLQAIGNKIKADNPRKAVVYLSSERFINQFVEAVQKGTVNDFMNFYQLIDVLLVDDIQFLSGKTKTQDYFFHVFNQLRQSGKQIVLASDRPPDDMDGVEERLLSRFKWGLNAQMEVPNFATRKSILKSKMYQNGIEMPEDVVEFIAHHVDSNIREMEGVLISLLAQSSLNRREVDLELAQVLLRNTSISGPKEITVEMIQKIVGESMSIEVKMMKEKTRKREIVQARQAAMYFAKEMTRNSLKSIGAHFGGRDHSTVIHAIQTVEDLMATDKHFRHTIDDIRKRISMEAGMPLPAIHLR